MKKIILIIFTTLFIYSIVNVLIWIKDSHHTKEIISEINKEIVPSKEERMISIDYFKNMNNDTVGFLRVNNTNINYPFLKTYDNSFYLNHSIDKTYSNSGWLFMDYKNNTDFNDQNTVIYAHARKDGTMFGTLKNVIKKYWYKNKDNHIITIFLKNKKINYQVFSTYTIKTEDYYITTSFTSKTDFKVFLNTIENRSIYNYNVKLDTNDKILTLSSCYTYNRKIVLHAKRLNE
jgi:sortase B